ncbi:E3 ubiquitin-protein ligase RING1-like protein [Morus notabilis]|uniref:RING-type E3 ubiquitin transferase n=1 Tax=Morus notabilis TaxID=981085 RepID=W9RYQ0_9ROSA|nr:E3 ubiquitin-protein ligase RING1-like protein [Morus notabilis]
MFSLMRAPSSDEYQINDCEHTCVFAQNTYFPDDQTLPIPMFYIVVKVEREYYPVGSTRSARNRFLDHESTREFQQPIHCFLSPSESKFAISNMLSSIKIPFDWESNLYWKDRRCGGAATLLNGVDDMVARVLEFAGRMIGSAAETGRKKLSMLVTIEKVMVVLSQDYESMVRAREEEEALESHRYMISRMLEHDPSYQLEDVMSLLRRHSSAFNREIELSLRSAAFNGSKPAAKSAVKALERFIYDGVSDDDESKLGCAVCMEEVVTGSLMIRMPCSHMFHQNCILKWLKKTHTCPICRFDLSKKRSN